MSKPTQSTVSRKTHALDIPAQAAEFVAAQPDLDARDQRRALALYRLLGEGEPVRLEDLAERWGLPLEEVAARLEEWPVQRDEQGRIFALGGLTLKPTTHALEVDGRTLYAWCALDTLFLPELLDHPARIRSTCPQTGEPISLTVDAESIHAVTPKSAVMSLHDTGGLDPKDAIATFCSFNHFFASEEAARVWTEGREGSFVTSLAEGFEYGHLFAQGLLGAALAAMPTSARKDLVRRLVEEGVNRGGTDVLDEIATPAFAEAARRWITSFPDAFPDFRMEIVTLIEEGDTVVAHFRCSGTHFGKWLGVPATGRRFETVDEIYFFDVADGKLAGARGIEDNLSRLRQLGISLVPPPA
jgi:alkylmercury lyase